MENNTDIIVLTSVIIVLFIVFIIATIREFNTINATTFVEKEEGGPRAEMLRFIGKLFMDDRIDEAKKADLINAVRNALEETESHEQMKKAPQK